MSLSGEGFDLLTYKGVDIKLQHLFSKHAVQNSKGQIQFTFYDQFDSVCDKEILGLTSLKKASSGVSTINLNPSSKTLFIASSYADLIFFSKQFSSRMEFQNASFLIVGADFNRDLILYNLNIFSSSIRVITLFENTILGKIMDSLIYNYINKIDALYIIEDDKIIVKVGNKKNYSFPVSSFSLRTFSKKFWKKSQVRTYKPKLKGIDSFYQLNQHYSSLL
jgi:hypothetical protein|tara:strand:+ start:465 stop:1127 length:663 start_codon:yes stop_codon:yes gene_type:complete